MTRVAILGMGNMGATHFAAYEKAGAQVVGFSSRNPRRLAGDIADLWGNLPGERPDRLPMDRLRAETDPLALIRADDVEAVSICTPTPSHAGLALAAIEAGKHVLCEKPLCRTLDEARRVRAALERKPGVVLMPGMVVRFIPAYELLAEAVADGRFGPVRAAGFERVGPMPPGWFTDGAASGGAALDLHLHDTDIVCSLFGLPRGVGSRGFRGRTGEFDHLQTQYDFAEGPAVVHAEGSWAMSDGFPFRARFTVAFERATLDYAMGRDPELWIHRDGATETPSLPEATGHDREIAHFVACVSDGAPPRVGVADAVDAMRVVEAECRSAERGEPVRL